MIPPTTPARPEAPPSARGRVHPILAASLLSALLASSAEGLGFAIPVAEADDLIDLATGPTRA